MKIAQVAPPWLAVPPPGYGGTERVVAQLADGLTERGHDVTLFASGGSVTKAKLASYYGEPLGTTHLVTEPFLELPHVLNAYARAEEFDVVHDHTFPFGPSIGAHMAAPPVVHTLHGPPWYPNVLPIYEFLAQRLHFVSISTSQQAGLPHLNYAGTVYNGIPVEEYPFRAEKDDYLLFVGRMSAEKGPHLAIETARRVGRRLVMAVKMMEAPEFEFFEKEVAPLLGDDVEMLGEVTNEQKVELYAGARCTLMPIQWPEPFGLVMTESMACGTPVVALRNGAAPEIIDHGVTGFVVDGLDEFAAAVEQADGLDPAACRARVEDKFSTRAMLDGYEEVFERVAGGG